MLGAQLIWLTGRMQRIREQQQAVSYTWLFGTQHRGLPAPIRLAADRDAPANQLANSRTGVFQPQPVLCGITRTWRPKRPLLSKREIASQNGDSRLRKSLRQGNQERAAGISSRAVRQYQSSAGRLCWPMQESAHLRIVTSSVKSLDCCHVSGFRRACEMHGLQRLVDFDGFNFVCRSEERR